MMATSDVREMARALALEAQCGSVDQFQLDLLQAVALRCSCARTASAVSAFATRIDMIGPGATPAQVRAAAATFHEDLEGAAACRD